MKYSLSFKPADAMVDPEIVYDGPMAHHRLLCWFCKKNSAVYFMPEWVFKPCWDCQAKIFPSLTRWQRFLEWLSF